MTNPQKRQRKSPSPELTGGAGFSFEDHVAAFYLVALLAENYAPGIEDRRVVKVSRQQRSFGDPLDDVIIDFEDIDKNPVRLSLQVKRSLKISNAPTNKEFREIIRDSWQTLKQPGFRINIDRYGAAVETISSEMERALKTLCDWARASLTADHFNARFMNGGIANKTHESIKNDIIDLLTETKGATCTNEETHEFLAHFVLIKFDSFQEGARDKSQAVNTIKGCLADQDKKKAPLVWSKVIRLSSQSAGTAGQFDRARLVCEVLPTARLLGALLFAKAWRY